MQLWQFTWRPHHGRPGSLSAYLCQLTAPCVPCCAAAPPPVSARDGVRSHPINAALATSDSSSASSGAADSAPAQRPGPHALQRLVSAVPAALARLVTGPFHQVRRMRCCTRQAHEERADTVSARCARVLRVGMDCVPGCLPGQIGAAAFLRLVSLALDTSMRPGNLVRRCKAATMHSHFHHLWLSLLPSSRPPLLMWLQPAFNGPASLSDMRVFPAPVRHRPTRSYSCSAAAVQLNDGQQAGVKGGHGELRG